MSMIQEKDINAQQAYINFISVLTLMFPTKQIRLDDKKIKLYDQEIKEEFEIFEDNFEQFKEILISIFCLKGEDDIQYNPSGQLAKKIAEKIKKGRQKKAQLEPSSNKKIAILSRYVSILAVGQQKNINDLMNYTVYQLIDEFNRFCLKLRYMFENFVLSLSRCSSNADASIAFSSLLAQKNRLPRHKVSGLLNMFFYLL